MKNVLLFGLLMAVTMGGGCAAKKIPVEDPVAVTMGGGCAAKKIPVEDPVIFTKYAQAIDTLKDPYLPSNSKEKYEAALFLDDHVDFSYARNASTLDRIFSVSDLNWDPESGKLVFSYMYRGGNIQFRFVYKDGAIFYKPVVRRE